jgi:hypothetical protein
MALRCGGVAIDRIALKVAPQSVAEDEDVGIDLGRGDRLKAWTNRHSHLADV